MNLDKIKIRKATLKDVDEIMFLVQDLLVHQYKHFDKTINTKWAAKNKKEYIDAIKKTNSLVLVAVDNKKIIGYFVGNIKKVPSYRKIKKIAEADNIYISKKYRRKGIGNKFLKEFFKWEKAKGVKRAQVRISTKNTKSIDHAKKAGFNDYDVVLERGI